MPVEYIYSEPEAYIGGAMPSQVEHWGNVPVRTRSCLDLEI
jgi:hypothetical protein